MAHTYHELKGKTIQELREIAAGSGDESVKGASQMNKDHLLPVLCKVLGIDPHEHAEVVGIDKLGIKAKMRELREQRQKALDAHDPVALASARRQLHHLNHQIRSHRARPA